MAAALALLVLFWFAYDALCSTTGRAAFLIVDAAMATAMSANVFI